MGSINSKVAMQPGSPAGTVSSTVSATSGFEYASDFRITGSMAGTSALLVARYASITYNGAGDITGLGHIIGEYGLAEFNAATRTAALAIGVEGATKATAGNITQSIGVLGTLIDNAVGQTITIHSGVQGGINANAGTISNLAGFNAVVQANSGTITNYIGFSVGDVSAISGITRKWGYYNFNQDMPLFSASSICDASYSIPTAPTNGGTTTITRDKTFWILNPAGTIATHTLSLPTNMADGQDLIFYTTNQITALTIAGNGQSVFGGPTTLLGSGFFKLHFLNGLGWVRVG